MSRSFYSDYKRRQFANKKIRKFTNKKLRTTYGDEEIPDGGVYKKIAGRCIVGQDVYNISTHRWKKQHKNNITSRGKKLVDKKVFNKFKHRQQIQKFNETFKTEILSMIKGMHYNYIAEVLR